MRIIGTAFAPNSSRRSPATLITSSLPSLMLQVDGQVISSHLSKTEISEPLGSTPVRMTFDTGWAFVADNPKLLQAIRPQSLQSRWVRMIESNWLALLAGVVLLLSLIWVGYRYGIPAASSQIVEWIPKEAQQSFGEHVLESLDEEFSESELPDSEQAAIRERIVQFQQQLPPLPFELQVHFRNGEGMVNAFALPGGNIILTDEIIELAEQHQQLDSVILHEIGHVHYQHVMNSVVETSLLAISVALLTGEASGALDTLVGVGVVVLGNGQSREHEREADQYAKRNMLYIYGSAEPMAEMFEKLHALETYDVPSWLSTHPDTEERIEQIRK